MTTGRGAAATGPYVVVLLLLFAAGCGREASERRDRDGPGTDPAAADTAGTGEPVGAAPVRGRYELVTVNGSGLPATTAEGPPGCQLQIVGGTLDLMGGAPSGPDRFRLRTRTRRLCGAEVRNRASYETRGGAVVVDDRIRLSGEDPGPGAIAGAAGRLQPGGTVVITRVTGEGGEQSVRWEFHRLVGGPGEP